MKSTYSFLLMAMIAFGCSSEKADVEKMQEEVFAVHDEVMPRIEEIMDLKSRISEQLEQMDSLARVGQAPPDLKARQTEGMAVNAALGEADSQMSAWMTQFKSDSIKTLEEAQATAYLTEEKKKIIVVRDRINQSIDRANKYLGAQK